jgi:two-component system phosphate regulon sensor histidine kinase PhoR
MASNRNTLLGMTEDTLTAAKEAARKSQEKKQRSSRILSIISLTGTFLLLAIWFGFLYHTGYTTLKHEVNTYFEEAFFKEDITSSHSIWQATRKRRY